MKDASRSRQASPDRRRRANLRRPLPAVALVAVALGCSCGEAPSFLEVAVEMVGARARTPHGVLYTDVDSPPTIRMTPAFPPRCNPLAEYHRSGRRWQLRLAFAESNRASAFATLGDLPPPSLEQGRLTLSLPADCGFRWQPRTWKVVVAPAPATMPSVKRLRALAADDDATALNREIQEQLERTVGYERVWLHEHVARVRTRAASPRAEAAWLEAADAASEQGLPGEEARRVGSALFVALQRKDLKRADALLQRMRSVLARAGEPRGPLWLHYYEGMVAADSGQFARAQRSADHAAEEALHLGLYGHRCMALETAAIAILKQGRHEAALERFSQSRRCAKLYRSESPVAQAYGLMSMAWVLIDRMTLEGNVRDAARAEGLLQQALRLSEPSGEVHLTTTIVAHLGWLSVLTGQAQQAAQLLDRAHTLDPKLQTYDAAVIPFAQGLLHQRQNRHREALVAFQRVQDHLEGQGVLSIVGWQSRFAAARSRLALGQKAQAMAQYQQAFAALYRGGLGSMMDSGRPAFFGTSRGLVDEYLHALQQAGRQSEAFAAADAVRAQRHRAFSLRGRIDGLGGDSLERWRGLLEAARQSAKLRRQLERREHVVPPAEAQAHARAIQDAQRAASAALTAAYEHVGMAADTARPLEQLTAALRSRLRGDEALIAMRHLDGGWHTSMLRSTGLRSARSPDPLGHWLPELAGVKHIYVVASTAAEVRLVREARARGRDQQEASLSQVRYAQWVEGASSPLAAHTIRVFANPTLDLPWSAEEAQQVAALYGEDATVTLAGDATVSAVRDALGKPGIVHIAGHATHDPRDPWGSHLKLANRETFTVQDILAQRVDANLVVLSVCGDPTTRHGQDEPFGLADALIAAGADAVLATTRPVQDSAAARWMVEFHRHAQQHPAAEAVRLTRRSVAGSSSEMTFELIGRRDPLARLPAAK